MKRLIVAAALALGACADTPPPDTKIRGADADWLQHAKPLPDVPPCDQPTEAARTDCDTEYQRQVRRMYVELADKHDALADFDAKRGGK